MSVEYVPKEQAAMEFMKLTGEERKSAGMKKAAEHHKTELETVQAIARDLAKIRGVISIDDVREKVENWNLRNAAGSVFKGAKWEFVAYTRSKRPEAHARIIQTWRLK